MPPQTWKIHTSSTLDFLYASYKTRCRRSTKSKKRHAYVPDIKVISAPLNLCSWHPSFTRRKRYISSSSTSTHARYVRRLLEWLMVIHSYAADTTNVGSNRAAAASAGEPVLVSWVLTGGEGRCWNACNRFGDVAEVKAAPLVGGSSGSATSPGRMS